MGDIPSKNPKRLDDRTPELNIFERLNGQEGPVDIRHEQATASSSQVPAQDPENSASSPGPVTVRRKPRTGSDRMCKVCGDKAVAHNFSVVSCESCKTFFRRNAHKSQMQCKKGGTCEIIVSTRRNCSACRLKKCFDIGMRADLILDEQERKERIEKINSNRKKRLEEAKNKKQSGIGEKSQPDISAPDSSNVDVALLESDSALAVEYFFEDLASTNLTPELRPNTEYGVQNSCEQTDLHGSSCQQKEKSGHKTDGTDSGTCLSSVSSSDRPAQDQQSGIQSGSNNPCHCVKLNCSCEKEDAKMQPFKSVPVCLLPSDPQMYWILTPDEQSVIGHVTKAFEEQFLQHVPQVPESLLIEFEKLSIEDHAQHMENFGPVIIHFMKKVTDFRALGVNDQQALLKASSLAMIFMISSSHYCLERDAWVKNSGIVPVHAMANGHPNPQMIFRLGEFSRTLKGILQDDFSAYALLLCLTLFDPLVTNVTDRHCVNFFHDKLSTVQLVQFNSRKLSHLVLNYLFNNRSLKLTHCSITQPGNYLYLLLLKHHLDSRYSYLFSSQYLEALHDHIRLGKVLAVGVKATYDEMKSFLHPLLVELFDLS